MYVCERAYARVCVCVLCILVKQFGLWYSKTCVKRPLSERPKMVFKADYRLMQVKSIAEYSKRSILQYLRPSFNKIFVLSIFEWPFYKGSTVYVCVICWSYSLRVEFLLQLPLLATYTKYGRTMMARPKSWTYMGLTPSLSLFFKLSMTQTSQLRYRDSLTYSNFCM